MNYEICLIALIGLPAAGKSSFCQWLLAEARKHAENWPYSIIHYCFDDYLKIPTNADIAESNYKAQRAEVLQQLELMIKNVKTGAWNNDENKATFQSKINKKLVVLCDDNHYYRSMRYKLFQLARKEDLAYGQIFFNCSLDMALERNLCRNEKDRLPNHVLANMFERLEMPLPQKYAFESNTLQFEVEADKLKIHEFILNSFSNKVITDSLEETALLAVDDQSQSTVHQLDILLRKRLKQILGSFVGSNKAVKAKELNERRKQIINLYKKSLLKYNRNNSEFEMESSYYINMLY